MQWGLGTEVPGLLNYQGFLDFSIGFPRICISFGFWDLDFDSGSDLDLALALILDLALIWIWLWFDLGWIWLDFDSILAACISL